MRVFFIKSTYNGNTYKVGDFYTGTEYKQYMTKMLDLNFKPTDGAISIMTRQITLPDETSIRDYTHMIVPEVEKIYEITKIDQQNSDQYRINLVEDAFIGNYHLFNNEEMIVTRTNEYRDEWYQGANDITDMSYDYTSKVTQLSSQEFTGSRMWLAVWVQPPDSQTNYDEIKIETSDSAGDLSSDSFDSINSIRSKYPEYTYNVSEGSTNLPTALRDKLNETEYVNKVVYNRADSSYYIYEPILVTDSGWQWNLGWHKLYSDSTVTLPGYTFGKKFLNNSPDVKSMILLFPYSTVLYYNNIKLTSGRNFKQVTYIKDNVSIAASILSVKLIPESILSSSGLGVTENPVGYNYLNISSNSSIGAFGAKSQGSYFTDGVAYLKSTKSEIDLSLNASEWSIYNREPFKHYELWIYGQKFVVPSYFVNNMRMVTNLTTDGITFNLYRDAEKTKLFASGTSNFDSKWSIDQLDLYAQNNPTYKDEFNNQQQQKWAQTFASAGAGMVGGVASGAAAGSIIPGLGTAAGAIMGGVGAAAGALSGIVNTSVQTHYDKKQFELMQRNKQMQPDQIYGNSAGASLIQKIRNGIYWVTKTGNNQSQMKNEYERKGYPTFITRKPIEMKRITNSLYGNQPTKIISGYFLKTLKNNYVTNEVNKKLTSGVTLIL